MKNIITKKPLVSITIAVGLILSLGQLLFGVIPGVGTIIPVIAALFFFGLGIKTYLDSKLYPEDGSYIIRNMGKHIILLLIVWQVPHLVDNAIGYTYAGLSKDVYEAEVLSSATITKTSKWDNINTWTVKNVETGETFPVTVRDVMYPPFAVQRRSADVQSQLNASMGQRVIIHEVFNRRGRGWIPFVDLTSFPVVYKVTTAE